MTELDYRPGSGGLASLLLTVRTFFAPGCAEAILAGTPHEPSAPGSTPWIGEPDGRAMPAACSRADPMARGSSPGNADMSRLFPDRIRGTTAGAAVDRPAMKPGSTSACS